MDVIIALVIVMSFCVMAASFWHGILVSRFKAELGDPERAQALAEAYAELDAIDQAYGLPSPPLAQKVEYRLHRDDGINVLDAIDHIYDIPARSGRSAPQESHPYGSCQCGRNETLEQRYPPRDIRRYRLHQDDGVSVRYGVYFDRLDYVGQRVEDLTRHLVKQWGPSVGDCVAQLVIAGKQLVLPLDFMLRTGDVIEYHRYPIGKAWTPERERKYSDIFFLR